MIGVILAAGKGSRMGALGDMYSKALLPVLDERIITHQISMLKSAGIRKLVIVLREADLIREYLENKPFENIEIRYVIQSEPLGIAHALWLVQSCIDQDFIVLLGDIYFCVQSLETALERIRDPGIAGVLLSKREKDFSEVQKNFLIQENCDQETVQKVIEKPHRSDIRSFRSGANENTFIKGCGIYLFSPVIFNVLAHTPRSLLRNEYELTDAIQLLIDAGHTVLHLPIITDDVNLTTPQDVLAINLRLLEQTQQSRVVASSALVSPDVRLHQSVVCEHARVTGAGLLDRCIVLPNTELHLSGSFQDMIFCEKLQVSCASAD